MSASLNQLQIQKLDTLLYRAAKIVTGAQKFTSKDNLLRELGWENTNKRIEFLCLTQFHKIIHRQTTPLIYESLPPLLLSRYPTRRTFEHYPCKKTFFVKSFFPMAIKLWDGLAMGLKGMEHNEFKTTGCSRKNVKSKMFVKISIFTKDQFSQLF